MRLRRILQRIGVVDRHVQLARDDGGKQRIGALEQLLAGADVIVELRPGRKQRAVIVELRYRKRRAGTEGFAEADEQAARLQAGQRARECRLAAPVIDDVAKLVAADLL